MKLDPAVVLAAHLIRSHHNSIVRNKGKIDDDNVSPHGASVANAMRKQTEAQKAHVNPNSTSSDGAFSSNFQRILHGERIVEKAERTKAKQTREEKIEGDATAQIRRTTEIATEAALRVLKRIDDRK